MLCVSNQRRMVMQALGVAISAVVLAGCSAPGLWVFEPAGTTPTTGAGAKVDPAAYADSIWASKVVPTVSEKAVEVATLLPAIRKDPVAAGKTSGIASTSGGAPTFMVKGSGKVVKVDTSDPHGPVTVDLGNGLKVQITTGPVITGTAIRDAMGIGFGEFANQIAYQNIGTALNNKSKTEVIAKLDLKSLEGKTLTFEGAFSASSVDEVLVVPTKLTVT